MLVPDAEGYDSFIAAKWFHRGRQGKAVRLLVLHCTVSPETGTGAESVARYFARGERKASAHAVVDNNSTVGCVHDGDTAFAAAGANNDGWHLELVGQADQTLAQWLDPFSRAEFQRAAVLLRAKARRFDIPLRWLTVGEVQAGVRGFCTHHDISRAFPNVSTGHYDPGPHFPKDELMALVTGSPVEDDMTPEQTMVLADGWVRDSYRLRGQNPKEEDVRYWVAQIVNRQATYGGVRDFILKA